MAMSDVNINVIMGNLTHDPKLSYTPGNTPFCNAQIASNWNKGPKPAVLFQEIRLYGTTAELLVKEGYKGKKIQVTGHLETKSFEEDDGKKLSKNVLYVEDLKFIGGPAEKQDYDSVN
jgi:single-strand DNA-binding protein